MKPTLKEMFAIPEIDTRKARQQRASGKNWSDAQRKNASQYRKPARIKIKEGTYKNGKHVQAS